MSKHLKVEERTRQRMSAEVRRHCSRMLLAGQQESMTVYIRLPVLFRYMYCHHLHRLQTLHHPAVPFTDPCCLHIKESIGHPAPQHSYNGLHIHSRRALRHRVPVLALEYGRWQRHCVLKSGNRKPCWCSCLCVLILHTVFLNRTKYW